MPSGARASITALTTAGRRAGSFLMRSGVLSAAGCRRAGQWGLIIGVFRYQGLITSGTTGFPNTPPGHGTRMRRAGRRDRVVRGANKSIGGGGPGTGRQHYGFSF
jgi:hypothetical protein